MIAHSALTHSALTHSALGQGIALAQTGTTTSGAGDSIDVSFELVLTVAIVGSIALALTWLLTRNAGSS